MKGEQSLSITIQPELRKRLEQIARSYRASLANMIDSVLNDFIEKEEQKLRRLK